MKFLESIVNEIYSGLTTGIKKGKKITPYEMVRDNDMSLYARLTTYGYFVSDEKGGVVERDLPGGVKYN